MADKTGEGQPKFDITKFLAEQEEERKSRRPKKEIPTEASYEKPGTISNFPEPKRGRPRNGGSSFTASGAEGLPEGTLTHMSPTPEQILANKQQKEEDRGFLRKIKSQYIETPSPTDENKKP